MAANERGPAIIKKKKVVAGGGGHHGGAWKVAYADFVTAMMAFFMLMWLLNATTEKQRKGIADYFSPTIPINRISGGGDGAFGGDSVFSETVMAQNGIGATDSRATESNAARGATGVETDPEAALRALEAALAQAIAAAPEGSEIARHLAVRMSDEGLVVELADLPGAPLFEEDTAVPTPAMETLLAMLGDVLSTVANPLAVGAHLAARPVVAAGGPGWSLAADRAEAARSGMEAAGLPPRRTARVTGHADRRPALPAAPMAAENNRIEITLLRMPPG